MIGQTLQVKRNTFFEEKKSRKKLANSIIIFFLTMQFIYGFNFGFFDILNKKIRNFCKVISFLFCISNGVIILINTPIFKSEWDIRIFWGSLYFIQYCGHIILLYLSKYKVYNFITDIRSIDDGIIHSEHKIGSLACIILNCLVAMAILLAVVVCEKFFAGCVLTTKYMNTIYTISVAGLDAIFVVQLIVNLYTYFAVKYLVELVGKEKVNLIRKKFFRISECCDKISECYGNLVVMEIFVVLPKYLALICNVLYNIKENVYPKFYVVQMLYAVYVTFQMCAPAVIIEAVNKQVESLRFKLYAHLMEETDGEKNLELSNLIRYMEQKPLYNKAWRVIPTDINLVVAAFSFVTTYVIVILQIMHVY